MVPVNTCQIRVGRLLEVDIAAGFRTVHDVDDMIAKSGALFPTLKHKRQAIVVADWRACKLFTPEVSKRVLRMLVSVNPHVERSAILHLADQSPTILQVFGLARESQLTDRQGFTHAAPLAAWLSEVLEPSERSRLRAFLGKAP